MKLRDLKQAEIKGKRVLVRVDFNVPLIRKQKTENRRRKFNPSSVLRPPSVADDTRIKAVWPTLKYLLDQGAAKIILVSHLGRPTPGHKKEFLMEPVRQEFYRLFKHRAQVEILENIRFDPREEKNSVSLARELAAKADLFVNDAFSVSHRVTASTVAITKFLPSFAGFLVEKEMKTLSRLLFKPKRPFVVIIGGAKMEEKLLAIKFFAQQAEAVLVGGLAAFELQQKKVKTPANVILPVDWRGENKEDIGPLTVALFTAEIKSSQTIFWQGNLGKTEDKRYEKGSKAIARVIAASSAKIKIAGGGDTVGFLEKAGLAKKFTYLTTGGGASLEFLRGRNLPGLEALKI